MFLGFSYNVLSRAPSTFFLIIKLLQRTSPTLQERMEALKKHPIKELRQGYRISEITNKPYNKRGIIMSTKKYKVGAYIIIFFSHLLLCESAKSVKPSQGLISVIETLVKSRSLMAFATGIAIGETLKPMKPLRKFIRRYDSEREND